MSAPPLLTVGTRSRHPAVVAVAPRWPCRAHLSGALRSQAVADGYRRALGHRPGIGSWAGGVPRQLFLPKPVASLRNVTEKSALGIVPNQCHFRHSVEFRQRCFRRCVDQLVRHDAAPLLHPPLQRSLQRSQVHSAETVRFGSLQPAQQRHRAGVRCQRRRKCDPGSPIRD